MATFFNQATLSYNGNTTVSNITTGEIREVLTVTKTALTDDYSADTIKTYIVSIINSGTVPFTNITVTDNLGVYSVGTTALVPLTYVDGSVQYYENGVLQPAPAVNVGTGLVISGIDVPAGGSTILIYAAETNEFAPLEAGSSITNTVTATGGNIATPVSDSETINVTEEPILSITKTLSPTVVSENGEITYTFVIQNTGNTPAEAEDNLIITDTFDPRLSDITVTYNGEVWSSPENYTYDPATGVFATVAGQITVPAATFIRNETTGEQTVVPGVSVVTVTGTI